jgi:hypothetical protein
MQFDGYFEWGVTCPCRRQRLLWSEKLRSDRTPMEAAAALFPPALFSYQPDWGLKQRTERDLPNA